MIGKARVSAGGFNLNIILTINGTTYTFDKKSTSSSVSNIYSYSRSTTTDDWLLYIYASGTINFTKLTQNVDICTVGGGGGGGGGSHGYDGGYYWHQGGKGGGGTYNHILNTTLTKRTAYTITVGAGGAGGATWNTGKTGGTTSFGSVITAAGGGGGTGGGGKSGSDGKTGSPSGSARNCFDNSSYESVSGPGRPSYKGGGGNNGTGAYNYSSAGGAGTAGLIVIRNAR